MRLFTQSSKYEHIFNESRCDWMPLVPALLKSHLFFIITVYISFASVVSLKKSFASKVVLVYYKVFRSAGHLRNFKRHWRELKKVAHVAVVLK